MRRNLRVTAAVLAVFGVAAWLALGANRGWTKTTSTRMEKDAVTDIQYPVIENHFSPGVELLGVVLLLSGLLAATSIAFKAKPKQ